MAFNSECIVVMPMLFCWPCALVRLAVPFLKFTELAIIVVVQFGSGFEVRDVADFDIHECLI